MELVAFDLETTGLSPKIDRIIEVGAVRFDDSFQKISEMQLLVDPGIPLPIAVERLTGIKPRELSGQPNPGEAVAQLADFCEGAQLVGHGSAFDVTFCSGLLPDVFGNRPVMDTLELARIILPTAESHSLPKLAPQLGLDDYRAHRALSDAEMTWKVLQKLAILAAELPVPTLRLMREIAAQAKTPVHLFLQQLVLGDGREQVAASVPASPTTLSSAAPSGEKKSLAQATVDLLRPDGPMAEDEAYELRESQLQMASAVAQVLERRQHLLVEAGTGTGKTLAYLAPLGLWAADTGKRAAVATRTITLQEQIYQRELPRYLDVFPGSITTALLKGRQHYISLRRWHRFVQRPDVAGAKVDHDAIRFKLAILVWLTQTKTGDRAELNLGSNESALWRLVESDKNDCLGAGCANWQTAKCHMVRARQEARAATLVVTNHSLLLADSDEGNLLGNLDAVVVDEAHHLEETATEQLGFHLNATDVLLVLERLQDSRRQLPASLQSAKEAAVRLFGEIKGLLRTSGDGQPAAAMAWTAESTTAPGMQTLVRSAKVAIASWRNAATYLRDADPALLALDFGGTDGNGENELAASALERFAQMVDEFLLSGSSEMARWLQIKADQGEIHAGPIDIAPALRSTLFDAHDTVILTSATLSVVGDFGYIRERLGVPGGVDELILESPFDYLNQALAVTVSDMPPYDLPQYESALALVVAKVARRLQGRTLALFTGYSALRRVHELLADQLESDGIAVLGQGLDGTRRQLLASFIGNPRTVLLGTNSFWEGIDIPGEALQCVVIAKLPFAVPTDPLVAARTAQLSHPFTQFYVPQAAIRLRQGFGRVIRHTADRAAVVFCDERLSSRSFGSQFLRALPDPTFATVSLEEVGEVVEEWIAHGAGPQGVHLLTHPGLGSRNLETEESA